MTNYSLSDTIRTYDRIAPQFAERNASTHLIVQREAFAQAIVGNAPPGLFRILDAGCGPGRDSNWFRQRGFQTIGVDLSVGMLAEASHTAPGVDFRQADLRSLDFPDGYFDGIWCCAALLHLERSEVQPVLNSFKRLLGHGFLWLSVKAGTGDEVIDANYGPGNPRQFTYFTRHEIELYVERAGFEVHDVTANEPAATDPHPWIAIRAQTTLDVPLLGAVGVIFDAVGRVLLSERADGRGWNLPGGVVDEDESPTEAVVRETKEETGLDVETLRLIGTGSWRRPRGGSGPPRRPGVVSTAYLCRLLGGTLVPTTEALRHDWFAPDSLPSPLASRWHGDAIAAAVALRQGRLVWPIDRTYGRDLRHP